MLTQDPFLVNISPITLVLPIGSVNSLRELLVSIHFTEITPGNVAASSTTPCGACSYCQLLDTRTVATFLGDMQWKVQLPVTCNTQGIVDRLQCPCNAYYVSKTRRDFCRRIYDHTYAASIGYFMSTIGRHIALEQMTINSMGWELGQTDFAGRNQVDLSFKRLQSSRSS